MKMGLTGHWQALFKRETRNAANSRDLQGLKSESLEPRVLFSADLPWAALTNDSSTLDTETAVFQQLQAPEGEFEVRGQILQSTDTPLILFNSDTLLTQNISRDSIQQNYENSEFEYAFIEGQENGLSQISNLLGAQQQALQSLQLVTSTTSEGVLLGDSILSVNTLLNRADEISKWREAFNTTHSLELSLVNSEPYLDIDHFTDVFGTLLGSQVSASSSQDVPMIDTTMIDDQRWATESRSEIVFVDSTVEDAQSLINEIENTSARATLEVILIPEGSSGMALISEILREREDIDAVHILSHGTDGVVQLGNDELSKQTLDSFQTQLTDWSSAFTDQGDILIYGCDLAKSEGGRDLVNQLAELTQADVAASNDLTGHISLGGDWDLEYSAGTIDSEVTLNADIQQSYEHILPVINNTPTTPTVNGGNWGVALNTSGTDDYLLASDADGLVGGQTEFTIEIAFSSNTPPVSSSPFLSYGSSSSSNEVLVNYRDNGMLQIYIGGFATNVAVAESALFDGEVHTLSVAWESATGTLDVYLDGTSIHSLTAFQQGVTIDSGGVLLFGQDQDSVGGGFDQSQAFSGVLHELRFFDDVRTATEISDHIDTPITLDDPDLLGNWRFDSEVGGSFADITGSGTTFDVASVGGFTVGSDPALNFVTSANQSLWVEENSSTGTLIGTASSYDFDSGDTLTFSLLDDAGGRFSIDSTTGELRVADGSLLNFESASTHTITIQVSDDYAATAADTFTVHLLDTNDSATGLPVIMGIATENHTLTADTSAIADEDGLGVFTYQWHSDGVAITGASSSNYTLSSDDVGTNTTVSVTFTDTKGNLESMTSVGVGPISGVNLPPAIPTVNGGNWGVALNTSGTDDYLLASDADGLVGGQTEFTIEIAFSSNTPPVSSSPFLSYGSSSSSNEVLVNYRDNGMLQIYIGGVATNVAVAESALFDGEVHTLSVAWESATGTLDVYLDGTSIHSLTAFQQGVTIDSGGVLLFGQDQDSVGGGFDQSQAFSGVLHELRFFDDVRTATEISDHIDTPITLDDPDLLGNWRFDSEVGGSFADITGSGTTFDVASVGGFTVGSDPALTFVTSANQSLWVEEDSSTGTLIGTASSSDPNSGDTLSYSLLDNAGGRFSIDSTTGEIEVDNAALLNFESAGTHTITVQVSDPHGATAADTFTVHLLDMNDSPVGSPVITGTYIESEILSVDTSAIADEDGLGAFTYQWYRDGLAISGASSSTYLLVADDVGTSITVATSYQDANGTAESLTSAASPLIANLNRAPIDISTSPMVHDLANNPITVIGALTGSQTSSASLTDGRTVNISLVDGDVVAQIFDADNNPLTSQFTAIDNADGDIRSLDNPVVAAFPDGSFMVVAQANGYIGSGYSGDGIIGKVFDSDGNALLVEPERADIGGYIIISDTTTRNPEQVSPRLDIAGDGTITVQWENITDGTFEQRAFNVIGPSVAEDAPAGTFVATLAAIDPDSGDTFTYSIVGGNPNFEIVGDEIHVKVGANLDYETATTESLTIRVTDSGGLTHDETVTIAITDVNDTPSFNGTLDNNPTYVEDGTPTLLDDTVELSDPNHDVLNGGAGNYAGSSITIERSSGANASDSYSFQDGSGITYLHGSLYKGGQIIATFDDTTLAGSLILSFTDTYGGVPNSQDVDNILSQITYQHQLNNSPPPSVQLEWTFTNTNGLTTSANMVVNITNSNDAPAGSVLIDNTTPQQGDTLNASNTLSDPDGLSGAITYQWYRDGVAISGATGNSYTTEQVDVDTAISVVASYTDDYGTHESVASIATAAVINVNDTPNGSVTIDNLNPAEGDILSVSHTLTDADGISSTIGFQWYRDGVAIIGATNNSYVTNQSDVGRVISVSAIYIDNQGTPESVNSLATATVTNVDQSSVITGNTSFIGNEGDVPTGNLSATDNDGLTDATYFSISTQGANGTAFIDAETGAWTFTPTDPNWHGADSFEVTVTDDLGGTTTQLITLNLANVNDIPIIDTGMVYSIQENSPPRTWIGQVTASDIDLGDSLSNWQIVGGDSEGVFDIDPVSGNIYVAEHASLDFETNPSYTLLVQVSDASGTSAPTPVTVNLSNVNEAPHLTSDDLATNEDTPLIIRVASDLLANDLDPEGLPLSLISIEQPSNGILMDNLDGTWTYLPDQNFNGNDSFTYTISDGSNTSTGTNNISVRPVNDLPVVTMTSSIETMEGGSHLRQMHATDMDGDRLTYHLAGGEDQSQFHIDTQTGELSLLNAPDYEAAADHNADNRYNVVIAVADGSGHQTLHPIEVTVLDQNEAPNLAASDFFHLPEHGVFEIGQLSATDPDTGELLAYQMTTDNDIFTLDETSGQISLVNDSTNPGVYELNVRVTDSHGLSADAVVRITIQSPDPMGTPINNDTSPESSADAPVNIDGSGDEQSHNDIDADTPLNTEQSSEATDSTLTDNGNEPLEESVEEDLNLPADTGSSNDFISFDSFLHQPANNFANVEESSFDQITFASSSATNFSPTHNTTIIELVFSNAPIELNLLGESFFGSQALNIEMPLSPALAQTLDAISEGGFDDLESTLGKIDLKVTGAVVGSVSLSAGLIIWMLRAGSLTASLLSSRPLWSEFDPLPVISNQSGVDIDHFF